MARTLHLQDDKLDIPKANGRHALKEIDGVTITVEMKDGKAVFSGETDGKPVDVFTIRTGSSGPGERSAVCYLCAAAQGIYHCIKIECIYL